MKHDKNIPAVGLEPIQDKPYGFKIASNREILFHENLEHDPFRPHRIRFYAMLFIQEGEGNHFIDFKQYKYRKGSIIFISKEQVHAFEKNWDRKALFLLFSEEFLEKGSTGSNLMQQLSLYNYHLYPPVIHLKEDQQSLFADLTEKIKTEFNATPDLLTEEIIQSSLKIFLCLAERIRKENRKEVPLSKHHEVYLQFQKLLSEHIFVSRKVKFYADKMLISTKKLNRITQEILDQTAKEYVNNFLLIEMKRLLMNTSFTIKEIAYQTGFEETTNFVKYFKKLSQMTPSEFRNQF